MVTNDPINTRFSVYFKRSTAGQIEEAARKESLTMSSLIRHATRKWLKEKGYV